jgi:hypothetical protein
MPSEHPEAYWKAVAKGLEAESEKAAVYVSHNPSLGVAREIMFKELLIKETPGPYLIRTGIVRESPSGGMVSKQCDLIVYDPHAGTAFYSIKDFVVVPKTIARVVIDIKSEINAEKLAEIVAVTQSLGPLNVPTLAVSPLKSLPLFGGEWVGESTSS